MSSDIYYYNKTETGFELYIGDCSTKEGLRLFDEQSEFIMTSFCATNYKNYGCATESNIPKFDRIHDVISFLEKEGDIGIIEFEATLPGIGFISSHDDSEFHYVSNSKRECVAILKKAVSEKHRNMLINKILKNPGLYMTCSDTGEVKKYSSFDEYRKNA